MLSGEFQEVDIKLGFGEQVSERLCGVEWENRVQGAVALEDSQRASCFCLLTPVVLAQQCSGPDQQSGWWLWQAECDIGGEHGTLREATQDDSFGTRLPFGLDVLDQFAEQLTCVVESIGGDGCY